MRPASRTGVDPPAGGPAAAALGSAKVDDDAERSRYQEEEEALRRLRAPGSLLVALSGGVDSAVLLHLAVEALGPDRVLAVTGRSASLAAADLDDARRVAAGLGVRHLEVDTEEMRRPGYRANLGERCFHCRDELFATLGRLAREEGLGAVAYGAIRDDASDFRPGMRAASRHGVLAPLLEAGLGKADVRRLAAKAGLELRDKPASACLSSRIPIGIEVNPERLRQVERAEAGLRALGFRQLRVRHHGEVARVELDEQGLTRLLDPAIRAEVSLRIHEAGFRFAAVDLDGYREGSLNPEDVSPE